MSADPADIGARLRAARERKGVTLRQIATRTKISIAALEALERNDISRLPGGIFSRAFVRSYAAEVGLDPEETIQDFIAQFPQDSVIAGHPRSDRVEDTEMFESDRRVASSVLWLFLISVPVAGTVLYFGMTSRPTVDPATDSPPAAPAAQVETPREVKAASEPALAAAPTSSAGAPVPAVAAPVPAVPTPAAPPPAAPAADDQLTVALTARGPVWVSATVDGQKALGRLLQSGEVETVQVKRELVITAGDAGAIRLTLNGSEGRALGRPGEVVTARLSPSNFKEYLLSR